MARIDEIAEGIASVLGGVANPEPLGVDLVGEFPGAATVLVRAVIESCHRRAFPISLVRISADLGKGLLRQLKDAAGVYEGVQIELSAKLVARIEFYRFRPTSAAV